MKKRATILQQINQALPPRMSYAIRKGLKHKSVSRFKAYAEYHNERFGEMPAQGKAADVSVTLKSPPVSELQRFRNFARDCIDKGEPEKLLASLDEFPAKLHLHPTFRLDCFVALISLGRLDEANELLRDTLMIGAYNKWALLRMLGDAYLFNDKELTRFIVDHIFSAKAFSLLPNEELYVVNTALTYLGEEGCIRHGARTRATPTHDLFFFLSNLRLHRGDFIGQVKHFNHALSLLGMESVSLKDDRGAISVTNIESHADHVQWNGPMVSIAMSTYNSSSTIVPVLESLMSQSYRNLEVLVVDDCSSDNTVEVASQFSEREPRIRVFQQSQNGGTYRARNRALQEARGEFFTCNDSDDWAHPAKIEKLVTPLLNSVSSVASVGGLLRINQTIGVKPKIRGYIHEDQSSFCYRREWAIRNVGYYEAVPFGADSEFSTRVKLAAGEKALKKVEKPLLFADWSRSSLTGSIRTGITDGGTMAIARNKYKAAYRERHESGQLYVGLEGNTPLL